MSDGGQFDVVLGFKKIQNMFKLKPHSSGMKICEVVCWIYIF